MKKSFEEIFEDKTKCGTKIKTERYKKCGVHPIIDQGQELVAGYTDCEEGLFEDVPVIIFGDHTRIIKYVDKPFFLGADGVKVLRSKYKDANYRYLYYALKNAKIPDTGYNRHFKWLKNVEIKYLDAEKQSEIVEILDKVSSIINRKRQEVNLLDNLIKSRFIELFGDISDDEKKTMADICTIITDGTHQPPKFVSEGIPFLLVSNIVTNEISYDTQKFISEETYAELIKRTPIEIGDVLLSTVGSYGHPAVVKQEKPFCFQRHIAYLKPNADMVDSEYLRGAILSADVQRQIDEGVKGIAQKTLNLSEIRKIKLPLPPIDRQKQFAAFVAQTDKSKLLVQKSLEETQQLFDALMQKYFS